MPVRLSWNFHQERLRDLARRRRSNQQLTAGANARCSMKGNTGIMSSDNRSVVQSTAVIDQRRSQPEGANLWKQRLFEAEAGLTKFVVESHGGRHLDRLLEVKREVYANLPSDISEYDWKAAFFGAQAVMEKFVVGSFGHESLRSWARSNGSIYGAIDHSPKNDATRPLQRLESQALLYGSEVRWKHATTEHSVLEITHCAIWDYREQARRRGVKITLQSPCEYCVSATTSLINNKGLKATCSLVEDDSNKGCVWDATR